MHYTFLCADIIENEINFTTIVDNILGIVVDISILFLASYFLTSKRQKAPLIITFIVTLCWSFTNVLYSRFFHHYISLSAMGQGETLFEWQMIRCVLDGLKWSDLYYILIICLFSFLIRHIRSVQNITAKILLTLVIPKIRRSFFNA